MTERRRNFFLVFIIYGDMAVYGFIQTIRGVTYPLIKNDFGASYNQQGLMVSLVSFMSVLAVFSAGIFLNRYGFRKSLGFAFITAILGMGLFYFIPSNNFFMIGGFWITAGMLLIVQFALGFFEIGLNSMGVKTFTKKSAVMLSLLHFFYGLGAILGPAFAGFVTNGLAFNWRYIYPAALVPVSALAVITFIYAPDERKGQAAPVSGTPAVSRAAVKWNYWEAVKNPLVWHFGIILGLTSSVEQSSTNWIGLYLQDIYGLDPKTTGALFVSLFFMLYTASRLLSGFIIEKTGYLRSVIFAVGVVVLLFAAGFILGRNGIWLLPLTGFFIAVSWPTMLALSLAVFKENAPAAASAGIGIAFVMGGVIQYSIGLINRYIGEAWGYRSSLGYAVLLEIMLLLLYRRLKKITGHQALRTN
jgi:fucose permease